MKHYRKNFLVTAGLAMAAGTVLFLGSCNKPLPEAVPLEKPVLNPAATQTIGEKIDTDTSYSIYKAVANKTPGLMARLKNASQVLTVIAPNNDAFRRFGIPFPAAIDALPIESVVAIGMYSVIPGNQYLTTNIPATFPNIQLPTILKVADLPGSPLKLQMSTFLSNGPNGFWVNNVPIVAADQKFKNGSLHTPYAPVLPPSTLLKQAIASKPDLSYFRAAIKRADTDEQGLDRLDSLLNYAVTNMTVLVPNDAAFQQLLFGSVYAHLLGTGMDAATASATATALTSTPDVFSNPMLFPVLTKEMVRGILAYHFLASVDKVDGKFKPNYRAFSNNFNKTPTFYQTLVNGAIPPHPGVLIAPTYTGPAVTGLTVTGFGTFPPGGPNFGGPPANVVSMDNHSVNGVFHVIDRVLLPSNE